MRFASPRPVVFLLLLLGALLGGPGPAHAVNVERVVSPGGIEAWLVRDTTIPVISLDLAFRGGSALDPDDELGLARMVSGLLDEGAGNLDSETFQRKLNGDAIQLGFDSSQDYVTGNLKTLKENRDTAFDLLRIALTAPRFDAEPVARVRAQILNSLRRQSENPNRIASETWYRTVFPDHPYGRPAHGTIETVGRIAVEDLRDFVATRLARANMVVGVVGDIAAAELARRLDETFGALPAEPKVAPVTEAKPVGAGRVIVVKKPIPQSVVIFGEPGIKRQDQARIDCLTLKEDGASPTMATIAALLCTG